MVLASETPDEPAVTDIVANWPRAEVTIEGTATVENDCTVLKMDSEPKVVEKGVVEVVLEARDEREVCKQTLQEIGYRVVVSYEDACPKYMRLSQPGKNPTEIMLNCL